MSNKIELISTEILVQHKDLSNELNRMNKNLALSAGWHYIMDWTWTICQIDAIEGKVVLDAGAGIGFLQWYLASQGAHVISVDRSDRKCIPFHLLSRFNVKGLSEADEPLNAIDMINIFNGKAGLSTRTKSLLRGVIGSLKYPSRARTTGSVKLYKKDLGALTQVPDNSVDVVVSISALEHNKTIDDIRKIVSELLRVLKDGGKMIITLPASQHNDWFFESAYSWCFTETTIRDIFTMTNNIPSNYDQYKNIFHGIKSSGQLKSKLSLRYYLSSNSGMPHGKWDPKYIPVGIVKTKQVKN